MDTFSFSEHSCELCQTARHMLPRDSLTKSSVEAGVCNRYLAAFVLPLSCRQINLSKILFALAGEEEGTKYDR